MESPKRPEAVSVLFRYTNTLNLETLIVELNSYPIRKETTCGWWIHNDKPKFVLKGTGKRFAYPTKEQAKESFLRRKQMQIAYAQQTIDLAKAAIARINSEQLGCRWYDGKE